MSVQKAMNAMTKTMAKTVAEVVNAVAEKHKLEDPDALAQDILIGLGLVDVADGGSVKPEKERKRVVSKKMKENFMKLEGATEAKLKDAIKLYKDTKDVDSFDALSSRVLGIEVKVDEKKPKEKKVKEKSGRFDKWTPTAVKLYKTIVEESGAVLNDELKKEFCTYVEGLTDVDFAASSLQGHMRSFITEKMNETVVRSGGGARPPVKEAEVEEEDAEEFDFEGEMLWIGVKSGKITRETDEAGSVLVGHAGKGRFKNVAKPE
jgi:hypothetical protein